MVSLCLSSSVSLSFPSQPSSFPSTSACSSSAAYKLGFQISPLPLLPLHRTLARTCNRRRGQVVRMAPDEEKMTRRSPLDFPIEWERPKPGRRADIFPQFSPMKTPLPPPMPADPPEEDEEEEEEKKEEEEEQENEEQPESPEGS